MKRMPFEFRSDSARWAEELVFSFRQDGSLAVIARLYDKRRDETESVPIDLPASDARRLRDWLNERYPEETTNGS